MMDYRSAHVRAWVFMVAMLVWSLTAVLSIWSTFAEIELLSQLNRSGYVSEAAATRNDDRQAIVGGLYFVAYAATAVAFCAWIYRASANLAALGVAHQRFSPGWSVGWWFVPVMSWFRPYQVMKELWKGSHPGIDSPGPAVSDVSVPRMLGEWWAAFLVSVWLARPFVLGGETIDELIRADFLGIASDGVLIAAGIMVLWLVGRITSNQTKKHVRLTGMAGAD